MKLEKWALVAEIVGGVAIVVTLILLLIGVRENNLLIRATMYTDRIESVNAFSLAIAQDPDLGRMWQAYVDGNAADLSTDDMPRLINLLQSLLRTYETAWFAREAGFIGDDEWTRFDGAICVGYSRSQATGFDYDLVLTSRFVEYIAETCPNRSD